MPKGRAAVNDRAEGNVYGGSAAFANFENDPAYVTGRSTAGAGDWDFGLFTHCFDYIDIMSEHFDSYAGQSMDHSTLKPGHFNRTDYMVKVDEPLVEWARRPANRVRNKVEAHDEYLEHIPALKTRRIPMTIDEWAYSGQGSNEVRIAESPLAQASKSLTIAPIGIDIYELAKTVARGLRHHSTERTHRARISTTATVYGSKSTARSFA